MKKLGLSIITAVLLTGLVGASADAQMGGGMGPGVGMGMWDGAHGRHIISTLGLDEKQSAEVKSIFFKLQRDMLKKRADIEVAEVELEEILGKDPVDLKAAEAKVKQIASLRAEATMLHIQGIEDVKAKLTPEQKKKLSEMLQMKGMDRGMMNCPMMKGEMPMRPHHMPTHALPQ